MKYESENFVFGNLAKEEDVGGGIVRKIMGYNDSLMLVRVQFEEGSIGYTHNHPHSQIAYVESGVFEFSVGEEKTTLKKGDCAYVPPDAEHGAVCLETGVLLDIFSPVREDFLEEGGD